MRALPLLALLSGLVPVPALAQVAAEDVWAATEAYWEVWGLDLTGRLERDGRSVAVRAIAAEGALPFGLGTVSAETPDLRLLERDDGTVLVETASPSVTRIRVAVTGPAGPVEVSTPAILAWEGREMVASGTPGSVTFTLRADRLDLDLGPFLVGRPGAETGPQIGSGYRAAFGVAPLEQATTVSLPADPAGLVGIEASHDWGEAVMDYGLSTPDGGSIRMASWFAPSTASVAARLPAGGVAVTGVAAALRDGLSVELRSATGATEQLSLTERPYGDSTQASQSSEGGSTLIALGAEGLVVRGELRGFGYRSDELPLPEPVAMAAGALSWELALPLLAGEDQRVALLLALRDITLEEATWTLLDPTGRLPRDPGALTISAEGRVGLPFDPVAPLAWGIVGARVAAGEVPLDLGPVTATLSAEGAGVAASAEAAFDFDEGDLATLDGFPRPEGEASATVSGLQGFIDDLVALGALAPAGAADLRAGLAQAFRETGPDAARSTLAIGPDGVATLNGRPLD